MKNVYLCIVVQRNRRAPKAGQKIFLGGGGAKSWPENFPRRRKKKNPSGETPRSPKDGKREKTLNDAGVYRYVMSPEQYSSLNQKKVIKEAALRSGVRQGVMQACWDAAGEVIKAWATEGHSVALPGLGSMRFGLNAKAVEDVNKVSSGLISSRKIIFVPNVELKDELKNTSINITCYDRNGNVVKSVKSSDDGTVEDPENENGTTGNGENGSTENGGSQNQGGNSNTGGDNGGNTGGGLGQN